MAEIVRRINDGWGIKTVYVEDDKVYTRVEADLSKHVNMCKEKYNKSSSSYFMQGKELFQETHCIPEVLYYNWIQMFQDKGIPKEEWDNCIYKLIQSPEYAAFKTSKLADKIVLK